MDVENAKDKAKEGKGFNESAEHGKFYKKVVRKG